jgi:hypothetical protein
VRLALQQGDTLKIRLINQLPNIDPARLRYVTDPGGANLHLNPTNLHTHRLLVPARAPTPTDPSAGDYIFVSVFNSRRLDRSGLPHSSKVCRPLAIASRIRSSWSPGLLEVLPGRRSGADHAGAVDRRAGLSPCTAAQSFIVKWQNEPKFNLK